MNPVTLWITLAIMSLAAVGFAAWPLYKHRRGLTPLVGAAIIFVVALSSGLYYRQGSPDLQSAGGPGADAGLPGMDDAIASLAQRLEENPDNADGWSMLGRSYMSVGNYSGAVEAFDKAMQLESGQNAQTLVALGEAQLAFTNSPIDGAIASLFENALALDPNNPQALFYGGIAAFNRDDNELAANRWERLLGLNPPAEIQGVLQQRIAEWRGEAPPAIDHPPITTSEPVAQTSEQQGSVEVGPMSDGAVVRSLVTLSGEAAAALSGDHTVFIFARDAAVPIPPIAAVRRRLSELPAAVELGDRESMVPGRELSGFPEFELIARVSLSGQPGAQPGDWFGTVIVNPDDNNDVEITIQQQVQ
jgi:cytochrome c-type biogenesis protein CcmH